MPSTVTAPTVLAVLVTHDGAPWLPRTLAALGAQTHPALEVVAVDNASEDGSRDLLFEHPAVDRVLLADRDLGFGGAVAMALDAYDPGHTPYVLFVHDDLELAPDAVAALVAAMDADPRLAVAGPKLRDWDAPRRLQSVGWTVDVTGRADSGVDPGELDQGQRDQERRALYVSTGGMLVRREALESLGGFDRRYHLFRDDLDLCWRAWLAGHEVEVVPDAVATHRASATNYLRLGQTRFIGPRYFAERNTLATLLKNYGPARLAVVVPLYVLVGIAKVLGFLLTRRVSDAWQTVRAWLWNVWHLRETWRLRRVVQRSRARTDAELRPLFGRIVPRVRAYVEAIVDWIAGSDVGVAEPVRVPTEGPPPEPTSATRRAVGFVRRRPILVTGVALSGVVLAGTWPLLRPGELRGGELAPWPATPAAFLTDYASGWHEAGAFGTSAAPSPAQAVLGLLHLLVGGSSYLAPRVLLLGTLALGWLLALRAGQTYSRRRVPRVVAATAYVLSPPALAALTTGRVGALVVLAVLPGIVAGAVTLSRASSAPAAAWRSVAGIVLLAGIGGAFEPLLLLLVLAGGVVVALVGVVRARTTGWVLALLARVGVATFGPVVLLLPWSADLVRPGGPLTATGGVPVGGELWRWLLLAPPLDGMPGLVAGAGFLLAGLLGLVLGVGRRPALVVILWAAALGGAVGGWGLDRAGSAIWPGLPLLVTAAAFAGLFAVAFATAGAQLTRHAFGWRHLAVATTALGVTVSLVAVAGTLVRTTWDGYTVGAPTLPSFVTAAAQEVGDFRVLVLAEEDGEVVWEVVEAIGPTMAAYGVPPATAASAAMGGLVEDLVTGRDPGVGDRLGLWNVRYVVVPAGGQAPELDEALLRQTGLEPRPLADGRLFSVPGWLPRGAAVSGAAAERIDLTGARPDQVAVQALEAQGDGRFVAELGAPGSVRVAEARDGGWRATNGGRTLAPRPGEDLVVFDDVAPGRVEVTHAGTGARQLAVTGQLLVLLLAISLALRPPGFARAHPLGVVDGHGVPPGGDDPSVGPDAGQRRRSTSGGGRMRRPLWLASAVVAVVVGVVVGLDALTVGPDPADGTVDQTTQVTTAPVSTVEPVAGGRVCAVGDAREGTSAEVAVIGAGSTEVDGGVDAAGEVVVEAFGAGDRVEDRLPTPDAGVQVRRPVAGTQEQAAALRWSGQPVAVAREWRWDGGADGATAGAEPADGTEQPDEAGETGGTGDSGDDVADLPPAVIAGPCAPPLAGTWTVPGLTTVGGNEARLRIANPYRSDATVAVGFVTPTGVEEPIALRNVTVSARSVREVVVNDLLPEEPDLAAVVRVDTGRVAVEGFQITRAEIGGVDGGSLLAAATAPAEDWTVPWVVDGENRATWLWVFNPTERTSTVELTLHTAEGGVVPDGLAELAVPPGELRRVDLRGTFPDGVERAAVTARSNGTPVVVSAAVQLRSENVQRTGFAVQLGATAPDRQWTVSAGAGGEDQVESLLIVNPTGSEAQVRVELRMGTAASDAVTLDAVTVPAGAVDELLLDPELLGARDWTAVVTSTGDAGGVVVGRLGRRSSGPLELTAGIGTPSGSAAVTSTLRFGGERPGLVARLGTAGGLAPDQDPDGPVDVGEPTASGVGERGRVGR